MAGKKGAGGPKPKMSATTRDAIIKATSEGLPRVYVAAVAGVSESLLYRWLRLGRRGEDPECVKLLHAIKAAEARGVAARLKRITAAAKRNWQADAWVLERTKPQHFSADRQRIKTLERLVAEQQQRIDELEGRGGPGRPDPAGEAERPAA